ncbi:MAG: hypothetical protein MZU97_08360 [Bacillus subtilis]|nr:hypothetical protein [Bacillus subtilis]
MMVAPSFFRYAIILFVWAGEIVAIHWIVELIFPIAVKHSGSNPSEFIGLLTPQLRKSSRHPIHHPDSIFLILLATMPGEGLWLLPIGVMAGAHRHAYRRAFNLDEETLFRMDWIRDGIDPVFPCIYRFSDFAVRHKI